MCPNCEHNINMGHGSDTFRSNIPLKERQKMKIKKIGTLFTVLLLAFSTIAGCGKEKTTSPLDGKWSYIYDTETTALKIKGDYAVLDGNKYEYRYDSEKIYLKDKKGIETGYRYKEAGEDGIYFYKHSTYQYQGDGTPNGLIGVWIDVENGMSSFEFTENGTFKEDSYIPGYYSVDEENGAISFVYNDHYEDTTIYYMVKDNLLFVEYPWPMVRTSK